jgi:hypothetical protein
LPDNRGLDSPFEPVDAGDEEGWTTLKIMSSPKPPSPAMYFKNSRGNADYIAKKKLMPGLHYPQGRKFYLHRWSGDKDCWRTTDPNDPKTKAQKVKVKPIKRGAVFYFYLDFENLSAQELGALLYALRPTSEFRHKLGLGKPLGLGSVRIDVVGICLVNRADRYAADGLFKPRYEDVWREEKVDEWPTAYQREKSATLSKSENPIESLRQSFRQSIVDAGNGEILNALEMLGNPANVRVAVHTPTVEDGETEKETYRWFVANDIGSGSKQRRNRIEPDTDYQRQFLKPLKREDGLTRMEAHPFNEE